MTTQPKTIGQIAACAHCGSMDARRVDLSYDDPFYAIQCWAGDKVGCGEVVGSSASYEDAEARWNRRIIAVQPVPDIEHIAREAYKELKQLSGTYPGKYAEQRILRACQAARGQS